MEIFGLLLNEQDSPDFSGVVTVAEQAGSVPSAQGPCSVARYSFDDCPPLDILVVPGGVGTRAEVLNQSMLRFLQERVAGDGAARPPLRRLLSVCTGAALLSAAGLLQSRSATTNKRAFSWVRGIRGEEGGTQWQRSARFVVDGVITTSAGVSAGIDAALHLVMLDHGLKEAQSVARRAEYSGNFVDGRDDPFGELAT